MRWRFWSVVLAVAAAVGAAGATARGDIGPLQTLVVVDARDRESRALGAYYLEKHGIPAATHRCEVRLPLGTGQNLALEDFEELVRRPVERHIEEKGLRGQIQLVVFCWKGPTRVNNDNSLSSVFFYGYKGRAPGSTGGCEIAPDSRSGYYEAARAFSATARYSALGSPLAFVLTARDLKTAKAVVDRAVEGHGTAPEAVFSMASSRDQARAVRTPQFAGVAAQLRRLGVGADRILVTGSAPEPSTLALPLMTCSLGEAYFPSNWMKGALAFAPGAIGEHLTSCGGQLPTPCLHQACVWDWLELGATVSYGTVAEPCNFQAKFPHARMAAYVARGFTLAEALAMSVQNPYQGLFAGDPLCAPYAAPPTVRITDPRANTSLSAAGQLTLRLEVEAHGRGLPVAYLDLYIDGRHYTPMARPMSAAGNEITISVGGRETKHTVARGEDLEATVQSVAFTLRTVSSNHFQATASGDLLTLSFPGEAAEPVTVKVDKGLAAAPYIGARVLSGPETLAEAPLRPGFPPVQTATMQFHLGASRRYALEYPIDLSFLPAGLHTLTVVARDGSALQTQGQASVAILKK